MKIKNIKPYKDKETRQPQVVGTIREVTAKRGKEIIKKGVAVEVPETSANPVSDKS